MQSILLGRSSATIAQTTEGKCGIPPPERLHQRRKRGCGSRGRISHENSDPPPSPLPPPAGGAGSLQCFLEAGGIVARRPEYKDRSLKKWTEIRKDILARTGNRCEQCGLVNETEGYRNAKGAFVPLPRWETQRRGEVPIRVFLTIIHLDCCPANKDYSNLRVLCRTCRSAFEAFVLAESIERGRTRTP